MDMKKYTWLATVALLLFVACKKGEVVTFDMSATLEQPTPEEGAAAKNYLQDETYIYWEEGDALKLSGEGNATRVYTIAEGVGSREAFLQGDVTVPSGSNGTLYAVYPVSSYVDDELSRINYPAVMPYRDAADALADFSFGKNCFPMVATFSMSYSAQWGRGNMDFHSVSGLLRVHLFSSLSTEATVQSIKFTSVARDGGYVARQLSGQFLVHGIETNAPYLESASSAAADKSITITGINKSIGGNNEANFLTFYLPLPAYLSGTQGGSSVNNRTKYALEMEVTATVGGETKTFTRTLGAQIQRNNITKMLALDVTDWTANGSVTGLVGNGTEERPFQIYTLKELMLVRDSFNSAADHNRLPVLNGMTVTENTHFKIMRSDIVLSATGSTPWTVGIKNFTGHLKGSMSNATDFGITNNSAAPLFESISTQGTVEYVTVKGSISYSGATPFSPLCIENHGVMNNCHNKVAITSTASVAGLCVTNQGTITSGANEAVLTTTGSSACAAGFCIENYGTLQGFYISSAMTKSNKGAGICYDNHGDVRDCVVTMNQAPGNTYYGNGESISCVVFNNHGTVYNCLVDGVMRSSDGNCYIGGVAFHNHGTIDNCISSLTVLNSKAVAGIAVYQSGADALISNCGVQSSASLTASEAAAGLVAYLQGGTVKNCYNRGAANGRADGSAVGGIVAFIGTYEAVTPATANITLHNVYSQRNNFYGRTASHTTNGTTTNNVNSGATTVTFTRCYSNAPQMLTNGGATRTVTAISTLTAVASPYSYPLAYVMNEGLSTLGSGTWRNWTDEQYPIFAE